MKTVAIASSAISALAATAVLAAEPNVTLELNSSNASYRLTIENASETDFTCKTIKIKAVIGNQDCTDSLSSYSYVIENKKIAANDTVLNSEFGMDYLNNMRRKTGKKSIRYCFEPEIKFDCK